MPNIIDSVPHAADAIDAWLKGKTKKDYAQYYKKYGDKYGVRWDLAICQSLLETNWYRYGGDVLASQNNMAGIGATGNGACGDSFDSPELGIKAHIQNLALRAGVKIPKDEIISDYVRKNYSTIANRNTFLFEQLAGTWAADRDYWGKISMIYAQMAGDIQVPDTATWFEIWREPAEIIPYAGSRPLGRAPLLSVADMKKLFIKYPNAGTVLIAPPEKKRPDCPVIGVDGSGPSDPIGREPPRPGRAIRGQKRKWIEWARDIGPIATQGYYPQRFPEGAVIHHTAGRTLAGDHRALQAGPYPCLLIDRDGTVYQGHPLDRWGYHTGTPHHRTHVGIEICGAGLLDAEGDSWFGQRYLPSECRRVSPSSGSRLPIAGLYHAFTAAQEASLIELLEYLYHEGGGVFSYDRVVGHDECMESVGNLGAKNDPGGSLSMTMPELRKMLNHRVNGIF